MRFLKTFLATESAGGIVMIAVAALAVALANSPLSAFYQQLLTAPVIAGLDVSHVVKDVLMAIFFLAVGMELKCEMREGALAAPGQKILPLIAALGGIIVPAAIYLGITSAQPELRAGWAIPTATDIAFALCVLQLLGKAVPTQAKVLLLAIAIYDDLAAILIIAFFYAASPSASALLITLIPLAALALFNRLHITARVPYITAGIALWFTLYHAGIHPTLAGVATAIAIPMHKKTGTAHLTPMLHKLHPYVAFIVLPIFAFTAAGVDLRGLTISDVFSPLPLAITLALCIGKPLGIFAAIYACVKTGIAPLPAHIRWGMVYAIATIAGIGFTMSLFIGQLAFHSPQSQAMMKLGVLVGSLISSAFGYLYLRLRRTS